MSARRAAEGGFTLLELLVAIMLLGALMAALFGALRLGTRVWETGEAQLDATARVQVVQDFLRQQLGQTVPMVGLSDTVRGSSAMLFVGARPDLRFVSMLPEHLGAGVSMMELALRPGQPDAPGDLVIRIQPLDLTGQGAATGEPEERVLIEGIESLEIAYFGAEDNSARSVWWQEWQGQRTLPRLVRIRVSFPPGDRRRWPELMIALMVDLAPVSQL